MRDLTPAFALDSRATSNSQTSVNVERRHVGLWVSSGKGVGTGHTHEQVEEMTTTHVYCLWPQEVIHLEI